MTAAVFAQTERRRTADRGLLEELGDQPTSLLVLGTTTMLIVVIGQLTGTLAIAGVVGALFAAGMIRLLSERRASVLQTASIGLIHLGVAMLIAGTV